MMKNKKGITLIALIITIIVVLTLAEIVVKIAVGKEGIIETAGKSSDETRATQVEEQRNNWRASWDVASTMDKKSTQTREKLLDELEENALITSDERKFIEENDYITIGSKTIDFKEVYKLSVVGSVGDYVNYTPDENEDGYVVNSTYSGYRGGDYTISQEDFTWRIYDIASDGTVTLISAENSISPFNLSRSYNAYNNFVYLLNDMCKNLYSNAKYGTARSIKLEDIITKVKDEVIQEAKETYGYGNSRANKILSNERKYPNIALKEENISIDEAVGSGYSGSEQDELITGYSEVSNSLRMTNTALMFDITKDALKNEIYYDLISGTNYSSTYIYWIATRCTRIETNSLRYSAYYMYAGYASSKVREHAIYQPASDTTSIDSDPSGYKYRPMVELKNGLMVYKEDDGSWSFAS
jgi:hypothetical protein